jgi:hypothetical protein
MFELTNLLLTFVEVLAESAQCLSAHLGHVLLHIAIERTMSIIVGLVKRTLCNLHPVYYLKNIQYLYRGYSPY